MPLVLEITSTTEVPEAYKDDHKMQAFLQAFLQADRALSDHTKGAFGGEGLKEEDVHSVLDMLEAKWRTK